jgi:RNase adaptor protein for sRNA GlmZ degradation
MNVPGVTANYQTVYQSVPVPQNASPQTRDLIDMSDAAAQAAMKRAIAIDAIADTEMQAANQINNQLAQAAPGTAPMVEAEAAALIDRAVETARAAPAPEEAALLTDVYVSY